MLTPEQIVVIRDRAVKITEPILEFLLTDIARRVSQAGQLTSTAAYQIWRAQQLGMSQREIKKKLQKILKVSREEIAKLLTQAAEVGYNFDLKNLPYASALPFEENTSIQQIVAAAVKLAQEDFINLTQTLGMVDPHGNPMELQDVYHSCTDYAFKQVITGATDYNTALRRATKNLADKGLRVIDYESGVHTSLEAAVRRNIMGGLGLMQEEISQQNHDDLDANGWELSAHANSAPDHEPFQGKQYTDAEYTSLNNSLLRRIGTLNCGHAAFPIILGVSEPQYTPEQLEQFRQDNEKGVTVDGRHYSGYEATQMQRRIERAIRKQKNRVLVSEAAGDKEKLLADQIKLQCLRQEYVRFSDAAGLRTEDERLFVSRFGHEQAARASKPAKKQIALIESFKSAMQDAGYQVKGFEYYTGDAEALRQMQTAFKRMAAAFPEEAKGLTIRLSRAMEADDLGLFDAKTRTIRYNQAIFKNWTALQEEYTALVKEGHFPVGTDARGCFYHEFGHAVWHSRGMGGLGKSVDSVLKRMGYGNERYGHLTVSQREYALRKELSAYAYVDTKPAYQEVIAECFSEWYTSNTPRKFCAEFLKEVGVL